MSSGIITLTKCDANLVGISIGGGAPLCPHVYIVQVFDNTPAAIDQTLESGDRIVAVNNFDVNGRTKLEVARMIQNAGVSLLLLLLSAKKLQNYACTAKIVKKSSKRTVAVNKFGANNVRLIAYSFFVKTTKIPKIGCEIFVSMCSVFACLALLSEKSK